MNISIFKLFAAFTITVLLCTLDGLPAAAQLLDEEKARTKNVVSLNDRISPSEGSDILSIPHGSVFVLTDIVIQNRSPGDAPVSPTAFSRVTLGPGFDDVSNIGAGDFFLTVVGNETLNIHFTTGRVVEERFRVFNSVSVGINNAPFIEFIINGFITRKSDFKH
jgi:hypothetical protein